MCKESLRKYKITWARRENVSTSVFSEWENALLKKINDRISKLSKSYTKSSVAKKTLTCPKIKKFLADLHDKYVIAPADKASNNIIFICKSYYRQIINEELGSTSTYAKCAVEPQQLIRKHIDFLKLENLEPKPDWCNLPSFYWMPKLHKNPYSYRFIAASHKCTTKPLSRFLNSALRLILKHFREYCLGIYRNTGVNAFWIVENSLEVLDSLRSIPTRKAQLASFDFSTLYTAIPHNLLKDKITNLIHSAYTCRKSQYIEVCQDKAFWSNNVSNKAVTAVHLVELFNYLIDNIYVCVDGSVFKQCVGIPMGTDCAPVVANLFLFAYEYEFMKGLLKDNITLAIKFSNTYRYIDDLLCINNKDFELSISDIYPKELILKKTNTSPKKSPFLDLDITITNNQFITKVYDKREDFNFDIVNFPHLDSNIPNTPAYGVFISQLIRYSRICSDFSSFQAKSLQLCSRLIKQGYKYFKLKSTFKTFLSRQPLVRIKYKQKVASMLKDCLVLPHIVLPHLQRNVTTRRPKGRLT